MESARSSARKLLEELLEELGNWGFEYDADELPDLVAVFCKHKRLIRLLLMICDDDLFQRDLFEE